MSVSGQHFLHVLAEDVEIDQCARAGILELMAHLPGGVQRVGVDDDQAGAHGTEHGDGVLDQAWASARRCGRRV